jgi:glycosyltransferase involved in cell wall biosynthesis
MTNTSLRALVVVHEPPLREGRGAGRLVLAMARGLRAHGIHVRVLAARQWFAVPGEPPSDLDIEVVDVPAEPAGLRSRIMRLRRPMGDIARSGFGERVREEARTADVVQFEEVDTAWCSEGLRIPSVLRLQYLVRWDRSFGAPWRRSFRQVLEFELAERSAIRRHRHFIASSPRVAAELRRRKPTAQVALVSGCLDPADYPPASLDGPPVAGLIGMADWPPTRDAVEWLIGEVWPEVRRRVPTARLAVAGRGMEKFAAQAGEGVQVIGEVPSAVDFLRGLSLLLYPIRRGSGIKVKTLEAIAVGVPVVTTPAGAEGIDGGDGIVVAETKDSVVAAAAGILGDAGERRERGLAARSAFEERYTPRAATEPLAEFYRRIVD